MGREIEMNPGELFMVADDLILVSEYETIVADTFKIGKPEHRIGVFFTFKGRQNNSDIEREFTIAMSPMDTWELAGKLLDQVEFIQKLHKKELDGE